jgi:hypothetical protein
VCCVLVALALVGPRFTLVLLWLFSTYLRTAYDSFLIPLLGFIFLPWTTLAYAFAQNSLGGMSGLGLVVVVLGVLIDIGVLGGGAQQRRSV